MALDKLSNLYRQVILDHAQHPRNQRKLESYSYQMELLNPTCGDAIVVQCLLDGSEEDDTTVVKQVAFDGYGCSISIASASMMTEVLIGKKLSRALEIVQAFNQLISSTDTISETDEEVLKDAFSLAGLKQFPSRYKCGILAWKAFEMGAIERNEEK